jgi:hypothetical protein
MQDPASELHRTPLLKLSEKGYEQCSEREFGQYTAYEMDRKAPLWRPTGLRREHLRSFSDSFSTQFVNKSKKRKGLGVAAPA